MTPPMQASAGSAVISGETLTRFLSTKGYYVPEQWDVYWANRQVTCRTGALCVYTLECHAPHPQRPH